MKRVLMISPLYPPSRHIGAKRALHFARHLPDLGWTPAVATLQADVDEDPALTPLVPDVPTWREYRTGPFAWIEDHVSGRPWTHPYAYNNTRPPPTRVDRLRRVAEDIAGGFDLYTRYVPFALLPIARFARREGCRAIYTNAGPHSTSLLGYALSRFTGWPLVVDLRDPWSIEPNYQDGRTPLAQRLVDWQEALTFAHAARVILNTESACDAYRKAYEGRISQERFTVIRNSFDPDLYGPCPEPPGSLGPLHIVYYGHLRPSKNAVRFLEGLRRFVRDERLGPRDVLLTTLGNRTPSDREAIGELGLTEMTTTHPWLPFTSCRELLGRADLLLDLMGPRHQMQISGKLFDYLACGRSILCVSPNPEVDRILAETGAGERVADNEDAIARALGRALRRKRRGEPPRIHAQALATYTARRAAERLATILEEVTA